MTPETEAAGAAGVVQPIGDFVIVSLQQKDNCIAYMSSVQKQLIYITINSHVNAPLSRLIQIHSLVYLVHKEWGHIPVSLWCVLIGYLFVLDHYSVHVTYLLEVLVWI